MNRRTLLLTAFLLGSALVQAAINPEEYTRQAPEQLRLKERGRIVENLEHGRYSRTTLLAEVVEVRRGTVGPGELIVVDWTVDTVALKRAREEYLARNGNMPGPQFMHEPDAPALDDTGHFWAHLARTGTRYANVQRHAGAVVNFSGGSGAIYVPVAGQYSFLAFSR